MLSPIKSFLSCKRIFLASGSPRRQELIKNIGVNVELCPSLFEENLDFKNFPSFSEFVEATALGKVEEVFERLSRSNKAPDIVIGADTVVTLNGKIYGKPKTREEAFETLSELVGKSHIVYTGVVIKYGSKISKFTETATVQFGRANAEQIQAYVDTGEPMDKAGSYGIQGVGGTLVERIDGDFFTVMGLPLYRLSVALLELFDYKVEK
ncbi:putative bifunctional dTTP/UTP pyrophosphatase/methyltransferase protein [Pseudolycoriella hygida]|uniref:Bifunctional dTTP/UTP pyrophosphatase/methyltransferase protein n=1 Tax=Pseudolycoriella hygida TaxID=35572 RepID=A0A9Q0S9B3_9DIPT|nr:putative bifunctional dTTP/UTP pyrophosphatase/methyltransferase protein [Pseudolycoriella hygida]